MSEEQPQPSERSTEVELEPLKPLESDIGSAMAKLMEGTPLEGEAPQLAIDPPPALYRRRMGPITNEVCPHGLAGFCLVCPRCPCNYLKARTLRAMIVELEYGQR